MRSMSSNAPHDEVAAAASPVEQGELRRWRVISLLGLGFYVGFTHLTMGLRAEHLVLATVAVLLVVVGGRAFRFFTLFLPCMLTGIAYDWFRLIKGLRGTIHVADLYHAELALFGIGTGEKRLIPAYWLLGHTTAALDFVTGLSYILYIYVPMLTAIALFWGNQRRMFLVGAAFFMTNLVGLIVYLAYPAAPPWYAVEYGLGPARFDVLPSAAGAARFDALVGVDFFANFYTRSTNVFGAMPSLHVAYPFSTMLALYGMRRRYWIAAAVFTAVVSFAAIYLQHHYVLDVVAGLVAGGVGFVAARALADRVAGVEHPAAARAAGAAEPSPSGGAVRA